MDRCGPSRVGTSLVIIAVATGVVVLIQADTDHNSSEDGVCGEGDQCYTQTAGTAGTDDEWWGPWSTWSVCSVTCGVGVKVRSRSCLVLDANLACDGMTNMEETCFLPSCRNDKTEKPKTGRHESEGQDGEGNHENIETEQGEPLGDAEDGNHGNTAGNGCDGDDAHQGAGQDNVDGDDAHQGAGQDNVDGDDGHFDEIHEDIEPEQQTDQQQAPPDDNCQDDVGNDDADTNDKCGGDEHQHGDDNQDNQDNDHQDATEQERLGDEKQNNEDQKFAEQEGEEGEPDPDDSAHAKSEQQQRAEEDDNGDDEKNQDKADGDNCDNGEDGNQEDQDAGDEGNRDDDNFDEGENSNDEEGGPGSRRGRQASTASDPSDKDKEKEGEDQPSGAEDGEEEQEEGGESGNEEDDEGDADDDDDDDKSGAKRKRRKPRPEEEEDEEEEDKDEEEEKVKKKKRRKKKKKRRKRKQTVDAESVEPCTNDTEEIFNEETEINIPTTSTKDTSQDTVNKSKLSLDLGTSSQSKPTADNSSIISDPSNKDLFSEDSSISSSWGSDDETDTSESYSSSTDSDQISCSDSVFSSDVYSPSSGPTSPLDSPLDIYPSFSGPNLCVDNLNKEFIPSSEPFSTIESSGVVLHSSTKLDNQIEKIQDPSQSMESDSQHVTLNEKELALHPSTSSGDKVVPCKLDAKDMHTSANCLQNISSLSNEADSPDGTTRVNDSPDGATRVNLLASGKHSEAKSGEKNLPSSSGSSCYSDKPQTEQHTQESIQSDRSSGSISAELQHENEGNGKEQSTGTNHGCQGAIGTDQDKSVNDSDYKETCHVDNGPETSINTAAETLPCDASLYADSESSAELGERECQLNQMCSEVNITGRTVSMQCHSDAAQGSSHIPEDLDNKHINIDQHGNSCSDGAKTDAMNMVTTPSKTETEINTGNIQPF